MRGIKARRVASRACRFFSTFACEPEGDGSVPSDVG